MCAQGGWVPEVYFEAGCGGNVYSVPRSACLHREDVARLEYDGRLVRLSCTEDFRVQEVEFVKEAEFFGIGGREFVVWNAQLIIDRSRPLQFWGSWRPLIPKLEAAAAANALLEVSLPEEEYQSLLKGGLDALKRMLTPRAASLVYLSPAQGGVPTLQLFRTGRCPA